MELKGSARAQDLPAVFHMLTQLLAMTAKEGLFTVWDDRRRKSVYFSRRGVTLLFPADRRATPLTGQTLIERGRITADDLERALHTQTASRGSKRLGEVLCEMNLVSEDEIYELIREQIQEEFVDMLSWETAQFEFREATPPQELTDQTASFTTLTLNPTEVLLEAARRLDEWYVHAEEEQRPGRAAAGPGIR